MTASNTIPIEVSARHVHLTEKDWTALFGSAPMTVERPISQRPQFSTKERVTLRGPKGELPNVAIVGPHRRYTQVELAQADAHRLGVTPPLRDSGSLAGAVPLTIVGPVGEVTRDCAIVQQRHLHLNAEDAKELGLSDRQTVSVDITGPRGARLGGVLVRVHPEFVARLHLDTDEGNACGVQSGMSATVTT